MDDAATILGNLVEHVTSDIARGIDRDTIVSERTGDVIAGLTNDECIGILDTYGECDLTTPCVDLRDGWFKVLRQLAYNALEAEVYAALPAPDADADAGPEVTGVEVTRSEWRAYWGR